MGQQQVNQGYAETARIEIPTKVLCQLISSGVLAGNDCKCLDNNARKSLWLSLLNSSIAG